MRGQINRPRQEPPNPEISAATIIKQAIHQLSGYVSQTKREMEKATVAIKQSSASGTALSVVLAAVGLAAWGQFTWMVAESFGLTPRGRLGCVAAVIILLVFAGWWTVPRLLKWAQNYGESPPGVSGAEKSDGIKHDT
jgi:hypothetical protein